jgi:hypothetical protein
MDARRAYEGEVIQLFANICRPPRSTISDDQYNTEIALARMLQAKYAEFIKACEAVNENSGFRSINMTAVREGLEDELPNFRGWQEAIDDARRGYIGSGLK